MITVGCCGFAQAHAIYFATFPLIEIQRTFYKLPQVKTAARWRHQEAPEDFTFTLKAWQLITHTPASPTYHRAKLLVPPDMRDRYGYFRPTDEVFAAWRDTLEIARTLRAPWVVFQCPASFTPTAEHKANMRAFFSQAERNGLIFAWEPRGAWTDNEISVLCDDLDLVHCVDPFYRPSVTGGRAYFRLHGGAGYDYDYRYSDEELARLAGWAVGYDEAWVLFNNVQMWEDALRFRARLAGG